MAIKDNPSVQPNRDEVTAQEFLKNAPTLEELVKELQAEFPGLTEEQIERLIP